MKRVESYILNEQDKVMLSKNMPMPSARLRKLRKEMYYCGCPEERELALKQDPFREAGLYEFMLVKMNLIEEVQALNIGRLKSAVKEYEELPEPIKEAMGLDLTKVKEWIDLSTNLKL